MGVLLCYIFIFFSFHYNFFAGVNAQIQTALGGNTGVKGKARAKDLKNWV